MSEPKFTPGPWKLVARRDYCDEFECWLHPINLHIHDKISDADVHLIAAAPELYEALEDMHRTQLNNNRHDPDDYENTEQCLRVKAALAKARGEG